VTKIKKILLTSFSKKGCYTPSIIYLKTFFSKNSKNKDKIDLDIKNFDILSFKESAYSYDDFQAALFYILNGDYDIICFSWCFHLMRL